MKQITRSWRWRLGSVAVVVALCAALAQAAPAAADRSGVAVSTLYFAVPDSQGGRCTVVGDLYRPAQATHAHPVPALLTTNGFGGSKDDLAGMAKMFASRGYAVLAYSGLGFGGSSCRVSLDSPDPDGRAASALISFLGGRSGIGFRDAARRVSASTVDFVIHDETTRHGERRADDPRVGMLGGSYGGSVQFAAAAVDPRLDTIVPIATWNDLSYSIVPNNTGQIRGVTTASPGAFKLNWGVSFAAAGVASGAAHADVQPERLTGCPNFPREVCDGIGQGVATGKPSARVIDRLRAASVTRFVDRVQVPTLLVQGENDTLFNLNESLATYRALSKRGVPAHLIWFSGGHSGESAPGDFDETAPDPESQYVTGRVVDWMDRHLKGAATAADPTFAYFRNWVGYRGNARPAYTESSAVDSGRAERYAFSGSDRLVADRATATRGRARLTTPVVPVPSGSDRPDALGVTGIQSPDAPGTYARWMSSRLAEPVSTVGSPKVTLRVDAHKNGRPVRSNSVVLFLRVVDVAPNGATTTVGDLVAPIRVAEQGKPFTVTMPAIVHRFAPGHRIGLVAAGNSANYRPGEPGVAVSIPASGGTFELPVR
ncbi:alpha/beta fold hydrolase [Gordonia sp. MP11Mi]